MKSNLKQQVADLQSSVQELTKRVGSLQGKFDSYLVPRLQKMDKEIVDVTNKFLPLLKSLGDWRNRQKQINMIFFDHFKEFVSSMTDGISAEEGMALYRKMISNFLKSSKDFVEAEDFPSD